MRGERKLTTEPRSHREIPTSVFLRASVVRSWVRVYNVLVMIAKDLLEILVCPACKQPLDYRENPESLKCTQCHRVYPVKDDIPIMLVDEATIEA
jgi:LSD1 subclass zinc finger protein